MNHLNVVPGTIWLTGITASGKTTLGNRLYESLINKGVTNVEFLDGDELRKRLNKNYGNSLGDRFAVLKHIVEIASQCNQNGYIETLIIPW